jgi:hypothetical protein
VGKNNILNPRIVREDIGEGCRRIKQKTGILRLQKRRKGKNNLALMKRNGPMDDEQKQKKGGAIHRHRPNINP